MPNPTAANHAIVLHETRAALDEAIEFVREGDVLVITRIDRLARSLGDLQDIVRQLKRKGVSLRATEQSIDTSTAAGKAFFAPLPGGAPDSIGCGCSSGAGA